jgi:hypothetical protein
MRNGDRKFIAVARIALISFCAMHVDASRAAVYNFSFTTANGAYSASGTLAVDQGLTATSAFNLGGSAAGWSLVPAHTPVAGGIFAVSDLVFLNGPPFYGLGDNGVWFDTGTNFAVLLSEADSGDHLVTVDQFGSILTDLPLSQDFFAAAGAPGPTPGEGLPYVWCALAVVAFAARYGGLII